MAVRERLHGAGVEVQQNGDEARATQSPQSVIYSPMRDAGRLPSLILSSLGLSFVRAPVCVLLGRDCAVGKPSADQALKGAAQVPS